jgi:hypothetical protein
MYKTSSHTAGTDSKTKTHSGNHSVNQEAIAIRAHEIYRERGGTDGRDLDDWLQAERELSNGHK